MASPVDNFKMDMIQKHFRESGQLLSLSGKQIYSSFRNELQEIKPVASEKITDDELEDMEMMLSESVIEKFAELTAEYQDQNIDYNASNDLENEDSNVDLNSEPGEIEIKFSTKSDESETGVKDDTTGVTVDEDSTIQYEPGEFVITVDGKTIIHGDENKGKKSPRIPIKGTTWSSWFFRKFLCS